jgi:hypothetical protein
MTFDARQYIPRKAGTFDPEHLATIDGFHAFVRTQRDAAAIMFDLHKRIQLCWVIPCLENPRAPGTGPAIMFVPTPPGELTGRLKDVMAEIVTATVVAGQGLATIMITEAWALQGCTTEESERIWKAGESIEHHPLRTEQVMLIAEHAHHGTIVLAAQVSRAGEVRSLGAWRETISKRTSGRFAALASAPAAINTRGGGST